MRVKLLFPPKWSISYPHLALPSLTGHLKENGILNVVNIVVGFPTETLDDLNETIKFISNNVSYIDILLVHTFTISSLSEIWRDNETYFIFDNKKKLVFKKGLTSSEIDNICRIFPDLLPVNVKNKLRIKIFNPREGIN